MAYHKLETNRLNLNQDDCKRFYHFFPLPSTQNEQVTLITNVPLQSY